MSPPLRPLAIAVPGAGTGAVGGAGWDPAGAAAAAKRAGAELLVLPRHPSLPAEASDGALAQAMGEVAAAAELPLLFAYAEACSGHRHLALQLVLADGRSTANYRATHLSPAARAAGWSPGNWLTMARLGDVTLGLLGGIDHRAPETGRALSGLGAEVLIAVLDPAAEPAAERLPEELLAALARLRALENGVPVCLVGARGEVHAADPAGRPMAPHVSERVTRIDLPRDPAARPAPRRPDLYRQLVAIPGDT